MDAELFAGHDKRCSRIFKEIIDPKTFEVAYICGPEAMIMDCKDALVEAVQNLV